MGNTSASTRMRMEPSTTRRAMRLGSWTPGRVGAKNGVFVDHFHTNWVIYGRYQGFFIARIARRVDTSRQVVSMRAVARASRKCGRRVKARSPCPWWNPWWIARPSWPVNSTATVCCCCGTCGPRSSTCSWWSSCCAPSCSSPLGTPGTRTRWACRSRSSSK